MKKPLSKRHQLIVHIPYKLLHFLNKENALSSYIENILLYNYEATIEQIIGLLEGPYKRYDSAFTSCFSWARTKQGLEYWNTLDNKWYAELRK